MGILLLCGLGFVLVLVLLVGIHLRLAGLPTRLKREIEARARADAAASEQAAAKRAGDELVVGVAAAAGELRAGVGELRKLQSAWVDLLIEQRAYTSELHALARAAADRRGQEDDQRATVEMPRPAAARTPPALDVDEGEPEEELTQVASRPIAGTPSAPNGLRLPSRAAIPPPPASRRGGGR